MERLSSFLLDNYYDYLYVTDHMEPNLEGNGRIFYLDQFERFDKLISFYICKEAIIDQGIIEWCDIKNKPDYVQKLLILYYDFMDVTVRETILDRLISQKTLKPAYVENFLRVSVTLHQRIMEIIITSQDDYFAFERQFYRDYSTNTTDEFAILIMVGSSPVPNFQIIFNYALRQKVHKFTVAVMQLYMKYFRYTKKLRTFVVKFFKSLSGDDLNCLAKQYLMITIKTDAVLFKQVIINVSDYSIYAEIMKYCKSLISVVAKNTGVTENLARFLLSSNCLSDVSLVDNLEIFSEVAIKFDYNCNLLEMMIEEYFKVGLHDAKFMKMERMIINSSLNEKLLDKIVKMSNQYRNYFLITKVKEQLNDAQIENLMLGITEEISIIKYYMRSGRLSYSKLIDVSLRHKNLNQVALLCQSKSGIKEAVMENVKELLIVALELREEKVIDYLMMHCYDLIYKHAYDRLVFRHFVRKGDIASVEYMMEMDIFNPYDFSRIALDEAKRNESQQEKIMKMLERLNFQNQ